MANIGAYDDESMSYNDICDIDKEIQEEINKGPNGDGRKITKLRFEQLLRGLNFLSKRPI